MSLIALLDIGSTNVNGFLIAKDKEKKIIFSTNVSVTLQDQMDINRFLVDVSAAAKEVLKNLIKSGHGTPKQIVCLLSAPFYASRISVFSKKFPEPQACTQKLIDQLVNKIEAGKQFTGHEAVENEVLSVSLNGYNVASPFGQQAQEFKVSHYLSVASDSVLAQLRQAVSSVARVPIRFCSFAFAFSRVLDFLTPDNKSYLALETDGEVSELLLTWRDVLRETVSFPFGENWLIRNLATELKTTPEEVRSLLRARLASHASGAAEKDLEQALLKLRPEWISAFRESLVLALDDSFLSGEIFLLGDASIVPIFKRWLEAESWQNIILGDKKLSAIIIDPRSYLSTLVEIIL